MCIRDTKLCFFLYQQNLVFSLLDFHSYIKLILPSLVAIKLLIVLKPKFDAYDVIVYIGGQKSHSLPTQFLKRIA
jgi:hypothetical protein